MRAESGMKLSKLRDIGWKEWDPIGLLAKGDIWDDTPFADEYDSYLRKVASDLRNGGSVESAVDYLLKVEREYMGLSIRHGQSARAEATALSIQRYLSDLDV